MSSTRQFTGKLTKIDYKDKKTLIENEVTIPSWYSGDEDIDELFYDELSDKYIYIDDSLYVIEKNEVIDSHVEFENDKIYFTVSYYDGGCSFIEALEGALEKSLKTSK
jgi:hypothetical protein